MKTNKDNGVVFRLRSGRASRPGLWLGLFALLLQTLIPFSQALSVTIGNGPAQSTLSLHCLTMADIGKSSTDANTPASPAEKTNCPVCQVFAIGKSQSSYVFQPALSRPVFIGWQPVAAAIPITEYFSLAAFRARAPPVVS